jgi:hypothetical protein
MSATWIQLRLTLLLAVIFFLGALAGHLTTDRLGWSLPFMRGLQTQTDIMKSETQPVLISEDKEDEIPNRNGTIRATRAIMDQYQRALSLSDEELANLKPLFRQTGIQMSQLPRGSDARLQLLESFHEKLRARLNPSQQKLSDEILERARGKFGA